MISNDQNREREEGEDDYRHRMKMNVLGLLVTILLVISGTWIVDSMAEIGKLQDCVLAGSRNCAPVRRVGESMVRPVFELSLVASTAKKGPYGTERLGETDHREPQDI